MLRFSGIYLTVLVLTSVLSGVCGVRVYGLPRASIETEIRSFVSAIRR